MNDRSEQKGQLAEPDAFDESEGEEPVTVEAEAETQQESEARTERTDMLQSTGEFFREHPALVLTLVYGQACIMGVIQMWGLSRQFGINMIDFATAGDFLLAGFKHPSALVYSAGAAGAVLFSITVYTIRAHRYRRLEPSYFTASRVTRAFYMWEGLIILLLLYTFVPPLLSGLFHAARIKSGEHSQVIVELRSRTDPAVLSKLEGEIFLIGTTEGFAFFYDRPNRYTHIIPISNIVHIHHLSEGSTWTCPSAAPTSILWEIEAPEALTQTLFAKHVLTDGACRDCLLRELQRATALRPGREGCQQASWDPGPEWVYCHVEVLNGDLAGTDGWVNASHTEKT